MLTHFDSNFSIPFSSLRLLLDKKVQNERPIVVFKAELNLIFKSISASTGEYFSTSGASSPAPLTDVMFVHILHPGSFRDLAKVFYARDFSNLQLNSGIVVSYPSTNCFVARHARSGILGIVEPFLLFVCPVVIHPIHCGS